MTRATTKAALAALAVVLAGCAGAPRAADRGDTGAVEAGNVRLTARGAFEGQSRHVTSGHASIGRIGERWVVILDRDFAFDGAPDPHVALGRDGYREDATLGRLERNAGEQIYAIPETLDAAGFNEVWIWCDQFAVPLGVARLSPL